jgi:ABC-type multidrug transport system fused ATPase/permease subunit
MKSELEEILRASNRKREKYNKKVKESLLAFLFLFSLIILASLNIFSTTLWVIVYVVAFIFIIIVLFRLSSKMQEFKIDISERIAVSLIKLSKTLKEYCGASSKELTLANNRLSSTISLIKTTILSQRQNDYLFDTSNLTFLSKLRAYLSSDVKEALSVDANKDLQEKISYDLEYLGEIIYSKQFGLAEKYLDKHSKSIHSKNPFLQRIKDFLSNSERFSSIFSFILIALLIIFLIVRYSLLKDSGGLGVLVTLLTFILGYGIYPALKRMIKWCLDSLFTLNSKSKEDKHNLIKDSGFQEGDELEAEAKKGEIRLRRKT